jgi:uncharacterized protein YodC (DUF2158 family)
MRWMNVRSESEPGESIQCHRLYDIAAGESVREKTVVAETQFKPGDTVTLRSGGPRMTIATVDAKGAFCEWFTDDQQLQSRSFVVTSLKLDEQR